MNREFRFKMVTHWNFRIACWYAIELLFNKLILSTPTNLNQQRNFRESPSIASQVYHALHLVLARYLATILLGKAYGFPLHRILLGNVDSSSQDPKITWDGCALKTSRRVGSGYF